MAAVRVGNSQRYNPNANPDPSPNPTVQSKMVIVTGLDFEMVCIYYARQRYDLQQNLNMYLALLY